MLKVVQIGLGPLGQKVVRLASERHDLRIVAAVDPAEDKRGKDVGELCGMEPNGLAVYKNLKSALKKNDADAAIVTTVSSIKAVKKQIEDIARAGLDIVSTCEELAFPWQTRPKTAKQIDKICKKNRVACVGTGINPGFLMDYLPSVLSSVCHQVDRIKVTRIQDASERRVPFQRKIGAGLTSTQFKARAAEGAVRHVGLTESVHMIARCINWKLDRTTGTLNPVIARRTISSGYEKINRGRVCGVEQIEKGYIGQEEVIRLHFRAAVGEPESMDTIEITGNPSITSVIPGGINGDIATVAIILNTLRSIQAVKPGLKTMLDLPVPGGYRGVSPQGNSV